MGGHAPVFTKTMGCGTLHVMANATNWSGCVELAQLSDRLSGLRLMSEASRREMESSLVRFGQLTPLVCCRSEQELMLVDGFKRFRVAQALGWVELRCVVHEVEPTGSAKLLLWQSNQASALTDLEQAWLVRSLYREDGLSQPQIAHLLQRHKSWVSRRLMLAEGLSEVVEALVRLSVLSATVARELMRLPRGNQEEAAQLVARRGMTSRQTARLVNDLLLLPDEESRQQSLARMLQDAELLPSNGIPAQTALRRTPGEWLIADITAVKRSAVRLHARLLERALSTLGEAAQQLALSNLEELRQGLLSLCRTIERRVEAR
jgi:ParB/RepB/Spo0J family partition protein